MKSISNVDRTDSVSTKLRQLRAAYSSGDLDIAMSLADSLKETLGFEYNSQGRGEALDLDADHFLPIDELPQPWARWARGWRYVKPLELFETVGIERAREPVDLSVAFNASHLDDPTRELRVARLNDRTSTLEHVPSQVYGERRIGGERHCHVVFPADVPAHEKATYFIFYGNTYAERPNYGSDLVTRGRGYALDIENHHFIARLSPQMGQLDRLAYKRQHSLELYAGGKGHGEPPNIDWAHDYVDEGHFQKLRMRNWPRCPNYEVISGPLCVRVRRFGFPYSPVYPVFAPSRLHMDQTYVFYAAQPYFMKEGRIDAIADVNIAAMRDDEWVFSGYSFTDTVWIDRQGKLHEGSVPAANAQDLWGVGFYHRTSRDAFIALWLEHHAENFKGLQHGGPPTLHYDGHGQLWSRYPAEQTTLAAGASIRQKNAYLVLPFAEEGASAGVERLRHQLVNPLQVRTSEATFSMPSKANGSLARPGETRQSAPLKDAVWKALREVRDEQLYNIDANIVDMGYVYDVSEREGTVRVLVTMPHRGRPEYRFLVTRGGGRVDDGIRERLLRLDGVREVLVEMTWQPPWSIARLSDAGRAALGLPS